MGPSGHLLRTLAAVAPGTRVAEIGCGEGVHTEPLARLGLDVWAVDADAAAVQAARARLADVVGEAARRVRHSAEGPPGRSADWAVVAPVPRDPGLRAEAFAEAARVLRPGGWVWVEAARDDGLAEAAVAAGLVVAEPPAADDERGTVHAVFRQPGGVG